MNRNIAHKKYPRNTMNSGTPVMKMLTEFLSASPTLSHKTTYPHALSPCGKSLYSPPFIGMTNSIIFY